jgi:hypothetical protein
MALSDFIARIKKVGLPNSSHFMVEFLGTAGYQGGRDVAMMVDQASLPGLNIMTTDIRTFGELLESPYGISYQPVQLSIIMDNESVAKKFFDDWSNRVFDRKAKVAGYYNNFVKDVRIILQDKNSLPIYSVLLREAFPKAISDVSLDYANHDLIRLNVTLQFRFWEEEPIDYEEIRESREKVLNPEQARFKARFSETNLTSDTYGTSAGSTNDFDWETPEEVGNMLAKFGPITSSATTNAFGRAINAFNESSAPNAANISSTLSKISSNFVQMNGGIATLGNNLTTVTLPMVTISTANSSISTNLTTLNSNFSAGGYTPVFGPVASNFSLSSSAMTGVTTLPPVPRHIQTIGANMTALGIQFQKSSGDFQSHINVSVALNKLGNSLKIQGSNMYNGGSSLQEYVST